jgi:SOUL heme-binding protein
MTVLSVESKPQLGGDYITPLLARLPGLVSDRWLILRFSDVANEVVVARYGRMEIRRTGAGLSAQTRVKGEREQALATALCRLRQFLERNHRSGIQLRLCRPLVQSEEAPGRWLVRIGISGPDGGILSPASRGGRVRVQQVVSETLAVVRLSGRATTSSVERGTATILDSIVTTPSTAAGKPMVRLRAPGSILPFAGYFEIAVPVTEGQIVSETGHPGGWCKQESSATEAQRHRV